MTTLLLLFACFAPSELQVAGGDTATVADSGTPTDTSTGPTDSGTVDTHDSADTDEPTDSRDVDEDGDGYAADVDCDDADPEIHPLQFDVCDGVDGNCSGQIDDDTDCPCPIQWLGDHAYLFCQDRSEWEEGLEACQAVGYSLASIGSEEENTWLHETADQLSGREWWVGLNDRGQEGTFTWVSGEALTYTNWSSGEPNDYSSGEDCAPINSADNERWNDVDCDDDNRFICETG